MQLVLLLVLATEYSTGVQDGHIVKCLRALPIAPHADQSLILAAWSGSVTPHCCMLQSALSHVSINGLLVRHEAILPSPGNPPHHYPSQYLAMIPNASALFGCKVAGTPYLFVIPSFQ